MIEVLAENLATVLSNSDASFALLGVFLLICFSLYVRRIKLTVRMLVYMSLMLALAILLQQFRIWQFPQGGSVTFGAMIPLLLLAYRYGVAVGALAGFVFGMINILLDPFILHPIQVLFDYPLPFMSLGLAGLFSSRKMLSTALAFACRFACHFISGVVFFASYAPPETSAALYSFTANLTYMLPECLICFSILKFLPLERLLQSMDTTAELR